MNVDSEGLEVLSRSECIELMRSVPIGRIVFTHQALPAVRPVSFSVTDETVIIPTRADSNLAAAAEDAVVAFQADAFDAAASSGWSVTVVGHAKVVHHDAGSDGNGTNPGTRGDAADPGRAPRTRSELDGFIRIALDQVSGRRMPAR
jgi:hypothetical protein